MVLIAKFILMLYGLNMASIGLREIYNRTAITFNSYHLTRGPNYIPGSQEHLVYGNDAIGQGILKIGVGALFILLAYYYTGKPEIPLTKKRIIRDAISIYSFSTFEIKYGVPVSPNFRR